MSETTNVTEAKARLFRSWQTSPSAARAAYTCTTERLPLNRSRLDSVLSEPYEGLGSAHLGTDRVIYHVDDDSHTGYVVAIRLRGDVYEVR